MASSMLTGDRRWAPTRKSGMTVLGKVPKPINLPSQRLENHGLDPNVEIVPKGTLTWGSRQSLAASNAWGTSSVSSPNTDGSAGSPSHISGRPSSGGSGTRPSTAGSDRSHEPVSNVWGPSSRPSSASGVLVSNQISVAATRPRSAETRPGSSQLSRFAENSVDSPVAWGLTGTAERLGVVSSKTGGFTMSSGDFPTLGSEKTSDSHTQRGHSSQGRPASASGTTSSQKETSDPQLSETRNTDHSDHGNVNTWKAENYPYAGHSAPPTMENWQKDLQHGQFFANMNMPPHQFDSWHTPPFHPSNGAWYRGGAAGGPYRPPGPPSTYPIDYHHVPARPLPNAQAVPRPEAGPGGFHPKNIEPFRPHMPPEHYMGPSHSDIQVRPGVYTAPVPYDGYYGPPHASFYNSTEREVPIMGMARPGVYNQYPTQHANVDPGKFHCRPGGHPALMVKEQMNSDRAHQTQGQYRVLLKQHDGWKDHEMQEQSALTSSPDHDNRKRQESNLQTDGQKLEPAISGKLALGDGASSQPASGREGHASDSEVRNLVEDSSKAAVYNPIRNPEAMNTRAHDMQHRPATKKNASLMEKVEGLNSKARANDGHIDAGVLSAKEKPKFSKDVNSSGDQFTKVVSVESPSIEIAPASNMGSSVPNKLNASTEDENRESSRDGKVYFGPWGLEVPPVGKSISVEASENAHFQGQRRSHGVKGVDHHSKIRSNKRDDDEWTKKSFGSDSVKTMTDGKDESRVCVQECHVSEEASAKQELHHAASVGDGSSATSSLDSVDHRAQRAKIKEMASQRAKQLQEEEEARTREQKAKALAKLEELNRRTAAESSAVKLSQAPIPSYDVASKPESGAVAATVANSEACGSEAVKGQDDATKDPGGSTDLSGYVASEAPACAVLTSSLPKDQFLSLGQGTNATESVHKTSSDTHNNVFPKQKQVAYRRRQSIPQDKTEGEKQASGSMESSKFVGEVSMNAPCNDSFPNNEELSGQHKKKTSRTARNKNKVDEDQSGSPLTSSVHNEGISDKGSIESGKNKLSALVADTISAPVVSSNESMEPQIHRDVPVAVSNQGSSESTEETHNRVNNQSKPHPHRKSTRNQQGNKAVSKYHGTEAVIWAPVRPANKNVPSEEASQSSMTEASYPSGKSGPDVQSGMKAKRAEMERYIPKPVAKELSQQVNSQLTSSVVSQAVSSDMPVKVESGSPSAESARVDISSIGKAAFASDTRNGENIKHSKQGRVHASWRQRSPIQSSSLSQVSPEVPLSSDPAKSVQKAFEQLQLAKEDDLQKGLLTHSDDGWNDSNIVPPSEVVASTVATKNYGASRQRRQPYKAHKGGNYASADNLDSQKGLADRSENQSPALGSNESDGKKVMKTENQYAGGEHMRPHWQPKSQVYSHYSRPGNRGSAGGSRVSSQGGKSDKESPLQDAQDTLMRNEDLDSSSQKIVAAEPKDACHQEIKREKKIVVDSLKEQTAIELAPGIVDAPHEKSVSLEVNRHGQYNGRFQRRQDTGHRGREQGQDVGRQNVNMNGDRRKNSPHLEYQRIGSYHKPDDSYLQNPSAAAEAQDGTRASGSRYRERGRNHPRGGGHFYGRSSVAAARVGDCYNSGE